MHVYRDINSGQVIESDEPRPDLLAWAYWREVLATAQAAPELNPEPVVEPEPAPKLELVEPEPEPEADAESVEAEPAPKPARAPRKPRTPKVAE